jgi:hypothetical protein
MPVDEVDRMLRLIDDSDEVSVAIADGVAFARWSACFHALPGASRGICD